MDHDNRRAKANSGKRRPVDAGKHGSQIKPTSELAQRGGAVTPPSGPQEAARMLHPAPLLQLQSLVIGYPQRSLCTPLNLQIPSGAAVGIIGANGSGKSTLIKTLVGLLDPLSGQYTWNAAMRCSYVPQEDRLSPLFPLTVVDVLKMGWRDGLPRLRGSNAAFDTAATQMLHEVELTAQRHQLISELSRGQRQRALIARALIGTPTVLFLDEPYSALDDFFRRKLQEIFLRRRQQAEFSFFMIEHDINRVVNQVDWVILLGPQETLCGPTADVITPQTLSRAYGTPLHVHEENGEIHVHFV